MRGVRYIFNIPSNYFNVVVSHLILPINFVVFELNEVTREIMFFDLFLNKVMGSAIIIVHVMS